MLIHWKEWEKEPDIWYKAFPITFNSCARLPLVTDGSLPLDYPRVLFSEIWYSIPMCASTIQSYHFAHILLLANKPHESTARQTTVANRVSSYRIIDAEVRHQSHEIVGSALGQPEGSVRIHQVQPLSVSGQCMHDSRERRIALDIRIIEAGRQIIGRNSSRESGVGKTSWKRGLLMEASKKPHRVPA